MKMTEINVGMHTEIRATKRLMARTLGLALIKGASNTKFTAVISTIDMKLETIEAQKT
jgi:hypothetical protein